MTIDKRFALVADNGDVLYPYIKTERKPPNRTGFFISRPGQKDWPEVTNDLQLVIERVVVDGWSVRARSESGVSRKREGVFGLGKTAIHHFKLAPELTDLTPRLLELAGERFRMLAQGDNIGAKSKISTEDPWALLGGSKVDPLMMEAATREVDSECSGQDLSASTRVALIHARVGQGDYRRGLLALWKGRCAVTGCSVPEALIASHAKPWRECETSRERLDKYNGLLLTASIDRLFDQGLISFADDGRLLRKPSLSAADMGHLGLQPDACLRIECLHALHRPYLAAHRALHGF